eukprot:scaffold10476_cov142-Cylindrotheca_fusiformis.AAC.8
MSNTGTAEVLEASSGEGTEVEYNPSDLELQESAKMNHPLKLDAYGFITNVDVNGHVTENAPAFKQTPPTTNVEKERIERRVKKWEAQLASWDSSTLKSKRNNKKFIKRLRKGIPDSMRGRVWLLLSGGIKKPGYYEKIVKKTSDAMLASFKEMAELQRVQEGSVKTSPTASESSFPVKEESNEIVEVDTDSEEDFASTKVFRMIQDSIERDIHRTFPRHNLFYEPAENLNNLATSSNDDMKQSSGDPELASLILNLESDIRITESGGAKERVTNEGNANQTPGGQAALRRVLRAYSYHDPTVGYCQGMNFIAGMFLTLMTEEEAFWVLVGVMNDEPCQMRGLFKEGMAVTHKVLHVAEKLTLQHLPRLARHFQRENIHVTMYATQWLLTQYTSSFNFSLVRRVWDSFLGEGWKIIYRVMLALLNLSQAKLLKMGFEDILAFFRDLPSRVNGNAVMEAAFKIPLKTKSIVKYEKEWEATRKRNSPRQQQSEGSR